MNFVFKTRNFVSKTRNFALKMMHFAEGYKFRQNLVALMLPGADANCPA